MKQKAMITIEILISMLILFMVIAVSVSSIKGVNIVNNNQQKYEDLYIGFLNIKDFINDKICKNEFNIKGDLSGYSFEAKCEKIKELRNYQKSFEEGEKEGNVGNILVQLFLVNLTLEKNNFKKDYKYIKMVTKSIF